jgi:hypothetical protein
MIDPLSVSWVQLKSTFCSHFATIFRRFREKEAYSSAITLMPFPSRSTFSRLWCCLSSDRYTYLSTICHGHQRIAHWTAGLADIGHASWVHTQASSATSSTLLPARSFNWAMFSFHSRSQFHFSQEPRNRGRLLVSRSWAMFSPLFSQQNI